MDAMERQAIETLLNDFARYADTKDAESFGVLFLKNGRLNVGGVELEGASSIVDYCRKRFNNNDHHTRHTWSNLRFESAQPDEISTTIIQVTYEHFSANGTTQTRVNDVFDRFQRDESGQWRMAERIIKKSLSFTSSGP